MDANHRDIDKFLEENPAKRSGLAGSLGSLATWPWWMLIGLLIAAYIIFLIITDEQMNSTFWFISGQSPEELRAGQIVFKGLAVSLFVAVVAYVISLCIGLVMGLMRTSSNPILYNISSFYVEIVRGIPMLVLLLYIAFALTPIFVGFLNLIGIPISTRDIPGVIARNRRPGHRLRRVLGRDLPRRHPIG